MENNLANRKTERRTSEEYRVSAARKHENFIRNLFKLQRNVIDFLFIQFGLGALKISVNTV